MTFEVDDKKLPGHATFVRVNLAHQLKEKKGEKFLLLNIPPCRQSTTLVFFQVVKNHVTKRTIFNRIHATQSYSQGFFCCYFTQIVCMTKQKVLILPFLHQLCTQVHSSPWRRLTLRKSQREVQQPARRLARWRLNKRNDDWCVNEKENWVIKMPLILHVTSLPDVDNTTFLFSDGGASYR